MGFDSYEKLGHTANNVYKIKKKNRLSGLLKILFILIYQILLNCRHLFKLEDHLSFISQIHFIIKIIQRFYINLLHGTEIQLSLPGSSVSIARQVMCIYCVRRKWCHSDLFSHTVLPTNKAITWPQFAIRLPTGQGTQVACGTGKRRRAQRAAPEVDPLRSQAEADSRARGYVGLQY